MGPCTESSAEHARQPALALGADNQRPGTGELHVAQVKGVGAAPPLVAIHAWVVAVHRAAAGAAAAALERCACRSGREGEQHDATHRLFCLAPVAADLDSSSVRFDPRLDDLQRLAQGQDGPNQ